jgi:hypothetical protein
LASETLIFTAENAEFAEKKMRVPFCNENKNGRQTPYLPPEA